MSRFILRLSVSQVGEPWNEPSSFTVEVEDGEPNDAPDEVIALLAVQRFCDRRIDHLLGYKEER